MFEREFKFSLHGHLYNAYVRVVTEHDYIDRVTYAFPDTMIIEDEDGNLVNEDHEDYDDIVMELESREYTPEWE